MQILNFNNLSNLFKLNIAKKTIHHCSEDKQMEQKLENQPHLTAEKSFRLNFLLVTYIYKIYKLTF